MLQALQQTPLDLIRLPVYWQMLEPAPGHYSDAYIEGVRRIITSARGFGFEVLVDLHQDGFGEGFGLRGAPEWAASARVMRTGGPWWLTYLRREVADAFDALYRGHLRGRYTRMLGVLAEALADVRPCGYELLNEPHWGREGLAIEERTLPEFYAHGIEAIRQHDEDALIGLAPAPFANLGLRTRLPVDVARGDRACFYAPHLYFAAQELGLPPPRKLPELLDARIATLAADTERLELPMMVTEFGVRSEVHDAARFITATVEALDRHGISACHWESGPDSTYGLLERLDELGEAGVVSPASRALCRPFIASLEGGSASCTRGGLELSLGPDGAAHVRHAVGSAPSVRGAHVRCAYLGPRELRITTPGNQSGQARIDFDVVA